MLGVTVDGNLADWGVTLANNNGSNLAHTLGANDASPGCASQNAYFRCEDTNDNSNNYQVTPYWGGQNYDVEFLGMAQHNNTLFFGIATGQRPDNGAALYSPGDLFLTINGTEYVIEMGGGIAGAVGGSAQTQGAAGSLFNIDAGGSTTGTVTLADQVAGSVWRVNQGTTRNGIGALGSTRHVQFDATTGQTALGMAQLYATLNTASADQHAVWEVAVDLSSFNLAPGQTFGVVDAHWGPSCYNDVLSIGGEGRAVPEPTTLALLGVGFLGLGGLRRKRQSA
ncbi:MAG: PEP-CTERM sorting domain-containing protein [Rhodocyclales bacterium]|nr:PEP-CTERM sorting domain-containing protein [Rhodocyclales bacterium]